jgi:hypothetical protein
MKISDIKLNPNNPRIIKDDKFKKLVKSIKEFPKMLELRPILMKLKYNDSKSSIKQKMLYDGIRPKICANNSE